MKIHFKNQKNNAIYHANLGWDWGAFFALFLLGLPFFIRKMNVLGFYCVLFSFIISVEQIALSHMSNWGSSDQEFYDILSFGILLGICIYFGIKGGALTARHYLEDGYSITTSDENLVKRAKAKWGIE